MNKNEDKCYWCGKKATSKEHVPPRCLFPEYKDIKEVYSDSFRKNLITVPSCDKHNLEKSDDDEYLMIHLTSLLGNNGLAYFHTKTKIARSIMRNPSKLDIVSEGFCKVQKKELPVLVVNVENNRLLHSFESIGRAIYYYECKEQFLGKCTVMSPMFRSSLNKKGKELLNIVESEVQKEKHKWIEKGDNPRVFKYRLGLKDGYGSRILLLTFYENIQVYILFTSMKACKIFGKKNKYDLNK